MPKVCVYLQLHQPFRLAPFSVFNIETSVNDYFTFDPDPNRQVFDKVTHKSYLPMLQLLLKLVRQFPQFHFAISVSGVWLEQAHRYQPSLIDLIKRLVSTGQVELLAETYYHSLASLYSETEFQAQVAHHTRLMQELFGVTPQVFRNTELIYDNTIGQHVAALGFKGMLTEAVGRYLGERPKTRPYSDIRHQLPLLLKHAELSDDIAFRFSDKLWPFYPLHADTYLRWLQQYAPDDLINLFMDFETFGEHQWVDTGIFDFFATVVKGIANGAGLFVTPSEVIAELAAPLPLYDVPEPISWADIDRDLTAWRGNELQGDALRLLYSLEKPILASNDDHLIAQWRKLQTSDHFYYMCTKWSADGDVHAYFSPYDSPWDAYNRFAAVIADMMGQLKMLH